MNKTSIFALLMLVFVAQTKADEVHYHYHYQGAGPRIPMSPEHAFGLQHEFGPEHGYWSWNPFNWFKSKPGEVSSESSEEDGPSTVDTVKLSVCKAYCQSKVCHSYLKLDFKCDDAEVGDLKNCYQEKCSKYGYKDGDVLETNKQIEAHANVDVNAAV